MSSEYEFRLVDFLGFLVVSLTPLAHTSLPPSLQQGIQSFLPLFSRENYTPFFLSLAVFLEHDLVFGCGFLHVLPTGAF